MSSLELGGQSGGFYGRGIEADGGLGRFGVKRIINAAGPVTRLGGNRLASEVAQAMADSALNTDQARRLAGGFAAVVRGAGN